MADERHTSGGFSLEEEQRILERRQHKAKRRKMSNKKVQEAQTSLNINSMMDLMTIILVFLLLSSNEQSVKAQMSEELYMPWSSATGEVADGMTITITADSVLVNDEGVVNVRNGEIPETSRVSAASPIIPDLQAAVERVMAVEERWAVSRQEAFERQVTIIADHETTYQVLTYVMMTASAAGVQEFKFAILRSAPEDLWNEGV